MQDDAAVSAIRGLTSAMYAVAVADAAHPPQQDEHLGARHELRLFGDEIPGLGHVLRMCRTVDEEGVWHGLGQLLRLVPGEYTAEACIVATRALVMLVLCPCGARVPVPFRPQPCPGECGRWFAGDRRGGAWSFTLPDDQDYS